MKLKKITAIALSLVMLFGITVLSASAVSMDEGKEALQQQFIYGVGPETEDYAIDYRYYSPAGEGDTQKYPLVIWLHGMGDGAEEGYQAVKSDIANWTSDEYQSRFKDSGGAFIFAPRSLEEQGLFWTDSLIYPLRAAIDDFIAKNKDNIDVSRIYIGGYSMGGKMTLKMAVAYPEMFAAIFPICPAWAPGAEQAELIADIPVWLTSGKLDPLVNYYASVLPTWNTITEKSNVAADCRFSTLKRTAYSNGWPTTSSHHAWYAVNADMFSDKNGDYPAMTTVDGLGNAVTLEYPDGMISWLSSFTSDYDGAAATDSGNEAAQGGALTASFIDVIINWIKNILETIKALFA